VVVAGAFTEVVVFEAEESIKFRIPLPLLVISMPIVQPSNCKPWNVSCKIAMLVSLTLVATSLLRLVFVT
jgi:hypothetical protein